MKRILIILACLVFTTCYAFSQQKPPDDLQKVKDALVNSVIYCQELEKQNANLNAIIKNVDEDLEKVVTIEHLDSLKVVYGIKERKELIEEQKKLIEK